MNRNRSLRRLQALTGLLRKDEVMPVCESCEVADNNRCDQLSVGPLGVAPDSYFCCVCKGYGVRDMCDGCRPSVEDAPEMYAGVTE